MTTKTSLACQPLQKVATTDFLKEIEEKPYWKCQRKHHFDKKLKAISKVNRYFVDISFKNLYWKMYKCCLLCSVLLNNLPKVNRRRFTFPSKLFHFYFTKIIKEWKNHGLLKLKIDLKVFFFDQICIENFWFFEGLETFWTCLKPESVCYKQNILKVCTTKCQVGSQGWEYPNVLSKSVFDLPLVKSN